MGKRYRGLDRRQSNDPAASPQRLAAGERVEKDRRQGQERRRLGFVSTQPLFRGVPYGAVEHLIGKCPARELSPDEVLLAPGQQNRHLYLLLEGQLKVSLQAVDSPHAFAIEPGETVGELSIIDRKPATAYVVATGPSRVLAIPEELLWNDFLRIPRLARNFIGQIAARFQARSDLIQRALEQQLRFEALQRELAIARDIQARMLPSQTPLFPKHLEADVSARMTPAREVGGDFFDALPLDRGRIYVAVGDVTGKGVAAALFMVRTLTLLRAALAQDNDLATAMRNLNRALCEGNPKCMFATLMVGILDLGSARFSYASGGHNPPVLRCADGRCVFLPQPPGMLMGVDEEVVFEVATRTLVAGDALVLYTDGVTEARNGTGALFGDPRLLASLQQGGADSSSNLIAHLQRSVQAFADGAPQSDDITLLVLSYRPDAGDMQDRS